MAGDYGDGGDLVPDNAEQQGGYCIEIYVGPDNKVQSVSVEQKSQEDAEEGEGGDEGQEMGVQVSDIRQALDVAMQIHKNNGSLDGAQPTGASEQEDSDLAEGYGNGNIRGAMPIRKVFRGNV